MYVEGGAATFYGGHDAPRSQGSPKCNRDSGEELPRAWGEASVGASSKGRPPQQLSCQAEYVLVLFLYCQPLVCLGFWSLLLLYSLRAISAQASGTLGPL